MSEFQAGMLVGAFMVVLGWLIRVGIDLRGRP